MEPGQWTGARVPAGAKDHVALVPDAVKTKASIRVLGKDRAEVQEKNKIRGKDEDEAGVLVRVKVVDAGRTDFCKAMRLLTEWGFN